MLKTYLQALLGRFYSKNKSDKAEVVQLRNLDFSKKQILLEQSFNGEHIFNFVAPASGMIVSCLENNSFHNGIKVDRMTDFLTLIRPTGTNSSTNLVVEKGVSFDADTFSTSSAVKRVYFIPFIGGG